jgi:hypothetical protein
MLVNVELPGCCSKLINKGFRLISTLCSTVQVPANHKDVESVISISIKPIMR